MKKTCPDWRPLIQAGRFGLPLFGEFEERLKKVSGEVFRVKTVAEARDVVVNLAQITKAVKVVAVANPLLDASGACEALKTAGISVFTDQADIAAHAESADIGLSGVEFGIAETGSVCQDGYAVEGRLVSMLPPIHVAFLHSPLIVPGITDAFAILSQAFDRGYISFITGPSRTADIERVLTIGVHGPSRFVLIAVDEEPQGGYPS